MAKRVHFGYRKVRLTEKTELVGKVFQSVARRYDLMNDLMSFGIHRLWKRHTVFLCAARRKQQILDLAGGTGDLAAGLHADLKGNAEIVVADINMAMLKVGRARLIDRGINTLKFVRCDAELLPFADNSFDRVVMGFGLRNVTDKSAALSAVQRVLKPGGYILVLEFSQVKEWLAPIYDLWSFTVLPLLGRVVAGDQESYRYLAESIRMHPNQEALLRLMEDAGLKRCEYFNLSQGIVAIHRGYKL